MSGLREFDFVGSVIGRLRSPDAAQRVALAKRCAAEPGPRLLATRSNRGPGSAKQREERCIAPGIRGGSLLLPSAEQSELRRVARGLTEAEVAEGVRGQQPPAR